LDDTRWSALAPNSLSVEERACPPGRSPTLGAIVKPVTLTVDDSFYESVLALAARDGVSLEEAAGSLVQEGIRARARAEAKALLAEMRERSTDAPPDEEAMRIAIEEQKAVRAELRASPRP